jgi:hypothetical protein
MNSHTAKIFLTFTAIPVVAISAFLTACAPPQKRTVQICPGKKTVAQALTALNIQSQNPLPIKAAGNIRFYEYVNDKKKAPENLNANLRFYPPYNLYFRGDNLLGEVMSLGTNYDHFWLRIKPKEVNAYWWGLRRDAQLCPNQLWINPNILLEALGIINVDNGWVLSSADGLDVLTKLSSTAEPAKKIYINTCDYRPRKIEYFDTAGSITLVAELAEYTPIADAFSVPAKINITHYDSADTYTAIDITLKNIKLFEPTESQLKGRLFKPPSSEGMENVFKLNENCQFIRQ